MEYELVEEDTKPIRKKGKASNFLDEMVKEVKKAEENYELVNPFLTIYPEGVNAVKTTDDGWEQVKIYVDSGATETVVGSNMINSVEIREGQAAKMGVKYEVANGVRIPNLGEKRFEAMAEGGVSRAITAQVADVNKALLSVSRLVKQGHSVVFDKEGSYIEDREAGERLWMEEEGGTFALNLWVRKIPGF